MATLRSALPEIVAQLPLRGAELARQIADETAEGAQGRARAQYGSRSETPRPQSDPSNPFGIETHPVATREFGEHVSAGGFGVYMHWYWYFGEFGTVHQPARPFLMPAFIDAYAQVNPRAREVFAKLPSVTGV